MPVVDILWQTVIGTIRTYVFTSWPSNHLTNAPELSQKRHERRKRAARLS